MALEPPTTPFQPTHVAMTAEMDARPSLGLVSMSVVMATRIIYASRGHLGGEMLVSTAMRSRPATARRRTPTNDAVVVDVRRHEGSDIASHSQGLVSATAIMI